MRLRSWAGECGPASVPAPPPGPPQAVALGGIALEHALLEHYNFCVRCELQDACLGQNTDPGKMGVQQVLMAVLPLLLPHLMPAASATSNNTNSSHQLSRSPSAIRVNVTFCRGSVVFGGGGARL